MPRLRVAVVLVLALGLLAGGWWIGVNRADDKPPPKRTTLPPGWTALKGDHKLTALQRQQAYKVRQDYNAKIAELKAKIAQLQDQERTELFKILTPAQKEQLAKILTGSGTKKESEKPKGTDKIKGKTTDK